MIIFYIIISVIFIFVIGVFASDKFHKSKVKNWKVGDDLILNGPNNLLQYLNDNNKQFATLKAWNRTEVMVTVCNENTYCITYSHVSFNHSDLWRSKYSECKKYMKEDQWNNTIEFNNLITKKESLTYNKGFAQIDGEPIEIMDETRLRVELSNALKGENYELAEEIKKALIRFR